MTTEDTFTATIKQLQQLENAIRFIIGCEFPAISYGNLANNLNAKIHEKFEAFLKTTITEESTS